MIDQLTENSLKPFLKAHPELNQPPGINIPYANKMIDHLVQKQGQLIYVENIAQDYDKFIHHARIIEGFRQSYRGIQWPEITFNSDYSILKVSYFKGHGSGKKVVV